MRHPLAVSLAAGVAAFVAANSAESALITAGRGNPSLAAWTSEVLLSGAFIAATYLWLHVRSLQGEVSAFERARIALDKELRLAAEIQRHLLKTPKTRSSPVEWYGILQPARKVGGDFYDVLTLPTGSTLILAADVSGKGIPAAIALASALAAFRQIARRSPDLPSLAASLAHAIHEDNGGTPYITAVLCEVDPAGRLRYVNAGHPAGRLAGPGGVVRLEPTGPPLGLLGEGRWEVRSVDTAPYTLGLLVTDGVVEALEGEGDPAAILDSLAARAAGGTPEAACTAVMQRALRAGPSSLAPPDDRTVVAFVPGTRRG